MQTSPCTHSIWVEKSIEVIGMGRYQWSLFTICGLGWVADTMWIQAFVVCLPAIQAEWGLQSSDTGGLLTCLFGGMILGALIWGTFSDVFGRKPTFNITLFITAVFGLASAFSQSFVGVCCLAALLGCGLGGNLPVDSTMLLEFVPSYRKNIVTLLAIFWPVGSLVGAGVGWALLPPFSCPLSGGGGECDPAQNRGWRYGE